MSQHSPLVFAVLDRKGMKGPSEYRADEKPDYHKSPMDGGKASGDEYKEAFDYTADELWHALKSDDVSTFKESLKSAIDISIAAYKAMDEEDGPKV